MIYKILDEAVDRLSFVIVIILSQLNECVQENVLCD